MAGEWTFVMVFVWSPALCCDLIDASLRSSFGHYPPIGLAIFFSHFGGWALLYRQHSTTSISAYAYSDGERNDYRKDDQSIVSCSLPFRTLWNAVDCCRHFEEVKGPRERSLIVLFSCHSTLVHVLCGPGTLNRLCSFFLVHSIHLLSNEAHDAEKKKKDRS